VCVANERTSDFDATFTDRNGFQQHRLPIVDLRPFCRAKKAEKVKSQPKSRNKVLHHLHSCGSCVAHRIGRGVVLRWVARGVGVEHGGTSRYAWQDGEGGKRGMEVKFFYSTWASVVVGRITASSSSD